MPWDLVKLNDGRSMPSIAYGTWTLGNGQSAVDQVDQALSVGFDHVDTAQSYRNEQEAGQALKESGLARSDIFVTTKWSGQADIPTSIRNSVGNLGISYVDLYLVHSPRLAVPDIPTTWKQMEQVVKDGLAKSIGISNFNVEQMQELLNSANIKPVANQILFHPYVYAQQKPILDFASQHGIIIEAYSLLIPLTHQPGGPLDKPLSSIASRLDVSPDQVLMAWAKAKGVVVVTTSSKESRLKGYLAAGDLKLTSDDIDAIDEAGAAGARRLTAKTLLRRAAGLALLTAGALAVCSYLGIDVL
ncbi:Aldo/keto reductase [Schizopora paradoxa]|uniref:Aldo/keto reductase n=1 Tax=Schizopora paradoxa TaxID=27342 RepID=A0A0H2S2V9_9AGAM|nr:Aldo/keto reductase [Schizopora paradoxa]